MKQSTVEFVSKMVEAKKMEQEALMGLLPPKMQQHIKIINKELKAMFIESALDIATSMYQNGPSKADVKDDMGMNSTDPKQTSAHVHKVEIG